MTYERPIRRVLIYKRTHEGDPDPQKGVFGNHKCMKTVRGREYEAVIGVGGIRPWAKYKGIARKLTWIGIGAHKDKKDGEGNPLVTFDNFLYFGEKKPMLRDRAPALARRMYDGKARTLIVTPSSPEWQEVKAILDLARNAPPSAQLKDAPSLEFKRTSGEGRSSSCRATSVAQKAEQKNPADAKERRG